MSNLRQPDFDIHDDNFIDFAFHQLSLGLLEQLWAQYVGRAEIKVIYQRHTKPISLAEIRQFEQILRGTDGPDESKA